MNDPLRDFSLMFEALAELQSETETAQAQPLPAPPSPADSISELGPLLQGALLLGLAPDGLPVLLNLHDSHPGPLLITADPGAGKTAFLQLIARAATETHTSDDIQFGIITNYPDEWDYLTELEHCMGAFPSNSNSAVDFLTVLFEWAHSNKGGQQAILLLIDDLESMNDLDFDVRQTLRWLLLRGPSRRVWPIITMNAKRASQVEDWLDAFRTRIFGQIKDDRTARNLANHPETNFRHLQAGLQFTLREGNGWLKFWLPETGQEEGEE